MIETVPLWISAGLVGGTALVGTYRYMRISWRHPAFAHVALGFAFTVAVEAVALLAVADEGAGLRGTLFLANLLGLGAMAALAGRFR